MAGAGEKPYANDSCGQYCCRKRLDFSAHGSPPFCQTVFARSHVNGAYGFAVGRFTVTKMMRLVLLWWISRLPSRVGLMCLTIPA